MRNEKGQFVKGFCSSPGTQFKKGELSREKHPFWKGGRHKLKTGYVMVNVLNHPRAYRNEVYEHIIVAEKKIGRYLEKGENVHHINGIKDDNRPDNLVVCKTWAEHRKHHRKYDRHEKNNIPEPKELGRKILVLGKRNTLRECSNCKRCNKLFWKDVNKKLSGFCSISCGSFNRWKK